MPDTAIAIRDTSAVILTDTQLNMISRTEFVPDAFRGNLPAILACVATGRALGLADMTALRGINVIQGKATLSAELMSAIARAHGHSITGKVTSEKAVVRGKRLDNGDELECEFTMEMAEAAGLLKNPAWKKHPDDMLWARAVSKLCRRLFADCFAGATYTAEDLIVEDGPTADELMDEKPGQGGDTPGPERAAAVLAVDEVTIDEELATSTATAELEEELLALAELLGVREPTKRALETNRGDSAWLTRAVDRARQKVAEQEAIAS